MTHVALWIKAIFSCEVTHESLLRELGRAVVYYVRDAHAFRAWINGQKCTPAQGMRPPGFILGPYLQVANLPSIWQKGHNKQTNVLTIDYW